MDASTNSILSKLLEEMTLLRVKNSEMEAKLDALTAAAANSNNNTLPSPRVHARKMSSNGLTPMSPSQPMPDALLLGSSPPTQPLGPPLTSTASTGAGGHLPQTTNASPDPNGQSSSTASAPSSLVGIKPIPLNWNAKDPRERGPVVASRHPNSIKIRNAIGSYGGSYSIYRALACAMGQLNPNHRPDYTNTEPAFDIPPNESWYTPGKIVTLDPWSHLAPQLFKAEFDAGVDIRPSIAVTRAQIKMPELDEAVRIGRITMDGKIVQRSERLPGAPADSDPGVEVSVSKAAVEPVWYLPGVAQRLGVTEAVLRRALFEETGGMYPELLTRHDLNVYLPPISGATVYIFGDPAFMSRADKEVTVRVHDECNGSDVFGSNICSCRPFLYYGIEEAVKTAQRGGSGVIIYYRKEGRALGEVTKYLVYNARKRGTDSASKYFERTELIAGVKDMRFQALMPDILHWLGVNHITNMISMSDMKYNAIVDSGIPIENRYEIPPDMIPSDSNVEIQAKIAAGYFSHHKVTEESLEGVVGRGWEDLDH